MKKSNFLKIALTLVMAFVITGAFAQIANSGSYEDEAGATPAGISYMTEGTTMPFYVVPDDIYHPGYDPATDDLTADGFTWTWAPATGETWVWNTELTLTQAANDNYVEIAAAAVTGETDYIVNVKEQLPASFGGCADPTGTDMTIRVVDAPEMGTVNYPYFNTTLGIADAATYTVCGNMAAADVTVQLTGYPKFQLKWTLTQIQIDDAGNDVGVANTIVDNSAGQTLGAASSLTRVTDTDYVLHNYAHTMLVPVADPVRTKYVYTLGGITDNVSRKSDFLTATTWYANTNQTYTIIVNPAPVTGPIYHIPNTQGNI